MYQIAVHYPLHNAFIALSLCSTLLPALMDPKVLKVYKLAISFYLLPHKRPNLKGLHQGSRRNSDWVPQAHGQFQENFFVLIKCNLK